MKKVFRNPFIQWLYRLVHPDLGLRIAQHMSLKNRLISGDDDKIYNGPETEWLVHYCKEKLKTQNTNYFIFGHRHLPLDIDLNSDSHYINTGDWISHFTYAEFAGEKVELKKWEIKHSP